MNEKSLEELARKKLENLIDDSKDTFENVESKYNRAMEHFEKNELGNSMILLMELVKDYPNISSFHNHLGLVQNKLGQIELAIDSYNKAIEIDNSEIARLNLGALYQFEGQTDLAIQQFEKVVEENPNSFKGNYNMGVINFALGDYESSEKYFDKALEIESNYSDVFFMLGLVTMYQGNHEAAIANFNKKIDLDPNDARPYMNLASIYIQAEQTNKAIETLKSVLTIYPTDTEIMDLIAKTFEELDMRSESIDYRLKIANIEPENEENLLNIGNNLFKLEKYDESTQFYEQLISMNSKYSDIAYSKLGTINLFKQDPESALLNYQKAKEINPEDVGHQLNINSAKQAIESKKNGKYINVEMFRRESDDE